MGKPADRGFCSRSAVLMLVVSAGVSVACRLNNDERVSTAPAVTSQLLNSTAADKQVTEKCRLYWPDPSWPARWDVSIGVGTEQPKIYELTSTSNGRTLAADASLCWSSFGGYAPILGREINKSFEYAGGMVMGSVWVGARLKRVAPSHFAGEVQTQYLATDGAAATVELTFNDLSVSTLNELLTSLLNAKMQYVGDARPEMRGLGGGFMKECDNARERAHYLGIGAGSSLPRTTAEAPFESLLNSLRQQQTKGGAK
jgi:hypothetical protein